MNKRSIRRGLLQGAVALVLGSQSLVYAQSSEPSAPAAPAAAPAESSAPAAPAPAAAPAATPAPSGAKVISILSLMQFAQNMAVDPAVLSECRLPIQGVELLETAAREAGVPIARDDAAVKSAKGRTFEVEITQVVSAGNAFTGHRKQVGVRGRLMQDGKEIAVFNGSRTSMGGAFAGFKGSCSVLGRCLEALSKDMAVWLKNTSAR
jgi:hypothetical protein